MKRNVEGQDESRKSGKDEPVRPACFDDTSQSLASKNLEKDGFCVIDLFSAREISEIQQGLMNEVDQENSVICHPLDDIVLSAETQASELFNKVVNVSFCRLAPTFDKRMMKKRIEEEQKSQDIEEILFYGVCMGLFHLRTEAIPANITLERATPDKPWLSPDRIGLKESVNLFFVVPLWGKERRTFLKGSHLFENTGKKITPGMFQQMGGRENMVNVSVEPGQALIYSMDIFYRLAEKSKDEPACAFFSSCIQLYVNRDDRFVDFGVEKSHNDAVGEWVGIFCSKKMQWIEDWLRKKGTQLEAAGKPDNKFGRTRSNIYQIIRNSDVYLQQIIGSVAHGLPQLIYSGNNLGRTEITECAVTTKFV